MRTLNENASRLWNSTLKFFGNEKSQQSFIENLDQDKDGKVTVAELKHLVDTNVDGFIDASEIELLGIKAAASDYEVETVRALVGALATAQPELILFEKDSETELWADSQDMQKQKDRYTTTISYSSKVLASRDLDSLAEARQGVLCVQEQEGNSCGTTSLSMLLKYYQGHNVENSVPIIDGYIRANGTLEVALPTGVKEIEIDGYTAPRDIVSYANKHGMRAGLKNNAGTADLKNFLNKGVPCLCLTDWNFDKSWGTNPTGGNPDGQSLHWVNVIGYEYNDANELQFIIANPHGKIQKVSEIDFNKVWTGSGPGLELEAGKLGKINTGIQNLFVTMVPKDDEAKIVAPDGQVSKAGAIAVPTGNDGIRGSLAKVGSDVIQWASEFQDDLANKGGQLISEGKAGYEKEGVLGVLKNLWAGDTSEIERLKKMAMAMPIGGRAGIVNELLNKGINRESSQQLVYDILKDTSWSEMDELFSHIDTRQLAMRLKSDGKAGNVLAWIARTEVDKTGQTGAKFEAFSTYLAEDHRDQAIETFIENKYTKEHDLLKKVPAATIRGMVQKLMNGVTDSAEESTIYHLFKACSWNQFDKVMSRMNMQTVASELENTSELANLTAWVIESAAETGHWHSLSEIVTHLESYDEYTRADDVLGSALNRATLKGKLHKIPAHIRRRMINQMDDITRLRSDDTVAALKALRKA